MASWWSNTKKKGSSVLITEIQKRPSHQMQPMYQVWAFVRSILLYRRTHTFVDLQSCVPVPKHGKLKTNFLVSREQTNLKIRLNGHWSKWLTETSYPNEHTNWHLETTV
jgi:hypothetical protein